MEKRLIGQLLDMDFNRAVAMIDFLGRAFGLAYQKRFVSAVMNHIHGIS